MKRVTLGVQLNIAFAFVLFVPMIIATVFSIGYFSQKIQDDAITKMKSDLKIAELIYQNSVLEMNILAHVYAQKKVITALLGLNVGEKLGKDLAKFARLDHIDMITIIDPSRKVLVRSHAPQKYNDIFPEKIYIDEALSGASLCGTEILERQELDQEGFEVKNKFFAQAENVLAITGVAPVYNYEHNKIVGGIIVRRILKSESDIVRKISDTLNLDTALFEHTNLIALSAVAEKSEEVALPPTKMVKNVLDLNDIVHTETYRKGGSISMYMPIKDFNGDPIGVLMVQTRVDKYLRTRNFAIMTLLLISLTGFLLAFSVKTIIKRRILIPVQRLKEGVEWVSRGEYMHMLKVATKDEIGELTEAFNKMIARLKRTLDSLEEEVTEHKRAREALTIQKAYLEELIENAPEAIVVMNNDDRVIRINSEFTQLFGYTSEEAVGRFAYDLIVPKDLKDEVIDLSARVSRGERVEIETKRQHKDGSLVDVSGLSTPIRIEDGQIGVYGIYRDITARKQAEEALKESEERHRIVLEAVPDPVAVQDLEGKVSYLNPAFTRVFGWTLSESIEQHLDFVPVENLAETTLIIDKINSGENISSVETRRLTRNGRPVDVSLSGAGFFNSSKQPMGYVLTFQDITERKRTEEEIRLIAYHDTLTGLPNRKSFYMRLEDELLRSHSRDGGRRRATNGKWALLFLDLDKFKYVNDTLGHDIGDELLKTIAARLQRCLRKSDYLFRLGGDEFTIILSNLSTEVDVEKVVQKIHKKIAQPVYIKGHEIYISVSIGISLYPDDGEEVESLVKKADMAMYAAKETSEGHRFFAEEMHRKALERMKLESSLRNGLLEDQFVVYYQPLVDDKNWIIGVEALLRWHHPELGLLSPSQFIPLAEETGAIIPIGKWVLRTACQQVKKWQVAGHTKLHVAVNLSTRQFKEPDLVETVEQVLEGSGLDPHYLKLEVTESGIMENPEDAIAKMKILRTKGIRFAIDDFGTGYSSLSYLKSLPIDTLKIDQSFVANSLTNPGDREIIKMIIAMAQNLNIDVLAEGVETNEQREFLNRHGCRKMQGYYFGRPLPVNDFEKVLQTADFKVNKDFHSFSENFPPIFESLQ